MNVMTDFSKVEFATEAISLDEVKLGHVLQNGKEIERASSFSLTTTLCDGPALVLSVEEVIDFATFAPFIEASLMDSDGTIAKIRVRKRVAKFINAYPSVETY